MTRVDIDPDSVPALAAARRNCIVGNHLSCRAVGYDVGGIVAIVPLCAACEEIASGNRAFAERVEERVTAMVASSGKRSDGDEGRACRRPDDR